MKPLFITVALLLPCIPALAAGPGTDEPHAFEQPSASYLEKFVKQGEKVFVYERYDAKGGLYQRDVTSIKGKIGTKSATERVINGVSYRLRGLNACPSAKITYEAEKWDCAKAAQDYNDAIYNNRAQVVLCKTLVLESKKNAPDAVSCFALVGSGTQTEPYKVAYDDDAMVFMNMASIGRNKDGKTLRPDLEHSSDLGKQFQNDEAN